MRRVSVRERVHAHILPWPWPADRLFFLQLMFFSHDTRPPTRPPHVHSRSPTYHCSVPGPSCVPSTSQAGHRRNCGTSLRASNARRWRIVKTSRTPRRRQFRANQPTPSLLCDLPTPPFIWVVLEARGAVLKYMPGYLSQVTKWMTGFEW